MSTLSLTARWIFPVSSPPLPGGVITIDGETIVAVEPHGTRKADLDLGDAVIIPGLVNAHTHLDLTGMHGLAPPRLPLPDWLSDVIAHRRSTTPEETLAAIRIGLDECIRTGTTLVGDIAGGGMSWEALAASGIRATVYYELIGMSMGRAKRAIADLLNWEDRTPDTATCRGGVSPHAPYSAGVSLYHESACKGIPFATHLAESAEEVELLSHRTGPFVEFLERLGVYDPDMMADGIDDILQAYCGANEAVAIAHGNYLRLDAPISTDATIVYCPRTHAAFGHDPHPWREFLARGVRVALGTDSLASNPDLDLLAEARFLRAKFPSVPGETLLHMATLAGAEALGWGYTTGSLESGKSADLAVIPISGRNTGDPHELFLASDAAVARVMCRGRWLV